MKDYGVIWDVKFSDGLKPQSTIFLSAAGEGSSNEDKLMSLPWMMLALVGRQHDSGW